MRDRSILMLMLAILLLAGASQAQERSHVPGGFGWTFGEETDTYYGVEFGVGLSNNLQIVGGFEKMNDVLTGRYALLLENITAITTVDIEGKVPATYGGVGARYIFPGLAPSPSLEAQFGATRTDSTGLVFLDGSEDITDVLPDDLKQLLGTATNFTFVLTAGVRFDFGDNFMAETTFDFFDVLAEREDFSTVSALRPAFASSQSSF